VEFKLVNILDMMEDVINKNKDISHLYLETRRWRNKQMTEISHLTRVKRP